MARRRRRRVPEVLRRAYHGRARTLEETILSLLPYPPPSPSDCRCGGRICLGCAGSTHLLREEDSTEYRLLLTRTFCILSSDAPPPPVDYLCSGSSQRSIVRNAMEILKGKSEVCSNTLFNGYDQQSRFSLSGESLSTYAWDLLVTRIGDPLMVFLLKFSSIFVPSTNKNWRQLTGIPSDSLIKSYKNCHQLTGTPLNSLIKSSKFLYSISESSNLQSFVADDVDLGDKIKMRCKYGDEPKMHAPFKIHKSSTSTGAGGSLKLKDHNVLMANPRKRVREYQRNFAETNNMHFVLHDSSNESIGTRDNSDAKHSDISESNLSLRPKESRKRTRLYSWQRRKKRKLNSADVIHKGTPVKEVKDFSIVKFQQNPDVKFRCQHLVSAKPDNFDAITEKHPLKDRSSVNVIGSITQEELGFISKKRAHSLLGEEMHCDQVDMSFVDNNCVCPQPMADKEPKESYVDMGCLGVPPMPMKKTLPPVVIQTCMTIPNLQNKSPQTEFSSLKQNELHSHSEKMASRCFHCLMLQAPERVADGDLIKRRFIFYDRFLSASVLPRSHILNRLRPNDSGALSLMKHIFGISEGQLAICSPSCRCFNGRSANNSKCLFHSLLGVLKSLIRNTQRCWNRKLLCKHCLVSPSKMFNNFNESTSKLVIEGPSSPKLFKKRDTGSQHSSSNMLVEGSHISGSGNKKIEQLYRKASKLCGPQLEPVVSYCRYKQVVSFIWAVTRRIVPLDLLGDKSTWRALRKTISKFVRLRRFEVFCLKQCIHGLRTSCYPFLSKIRQSDCPCRKKDIKDAGNDKSTRKEPGSSDDVKKTLHTKIFRCWIYWYFNYIVVPMVTANFYVTETESGRQDVFYYPKPVWRNLVDRTITSLSKQNYRLINNAYLRHILKGRQFGFSKVRFLPKEKNLRPIANLKARSMLRQPRKESSARRYLTTRLTNATDHGKLTSTNKKRRLVYSSVNSSLQDLHAILRKLKIDYPQKLGSSVFDYNDIYKKLLQFVSKARTASKTVPCVYLVVADVSKAFDSINQDILLNIMKNNIDKAEYFMRKYAQIVCTKKSTRTIYAREPYDAGCVNNAISTFGTSIRGILIDKGTTKIKQEKLIYLLKEHLKHNIVKLGQNFYLQKIGIPQGSLLSSLLCSFYYGHLESSLILPCLEKTLEQPNPNCWINTDTSNLDEKQLRLSVGEQSSVYNHTSINSTGVGKSQCPSFPEYMLLRLIDDFLFVSTSKKQATCFVNRLKRGFKNYNCYMNDNKFGLNFDMEEYSVPVNRKYTGADGLSFLPWSGLLLNCQTLEVQADYTRYSGIHMSSTITVHAHTKPAQQLREKLCDYMRPKCHPIFYDSRINSPPVVSLNAYQAFLLCAMKFHCYTCSMPDITNRNPSYLQEIIARSFRYMYKLIKKRMHELEHNINGIKPSFVLKKAEIVWLGLSAYMRILSKKQSRHKDLLRLLKCQLAAHGKVCNISSHLEYAVDDSHSSMFWKIRF